MTQETEREAFEIYYATRFPLLTVQEQNGMFYCDTQEHYLTWRAATSAADAKYLPLAESWLRYKQDMRPETRNDYLRASSRVFALALAAFKSVGV
jgi:hypothetical protein